MKSFNKYLSAIVGAALAIGAAACQDDFENRAPAFEEPVAKHKANMTINDFKTLFWKDADSYVDTVGFLPGSENEHIYISGTVVSNDANGNIFKSLVIQDETAAVAFSINQYDLYLQYRPGQKLVIDATGMYIGKYRGLQQFGLPSWYEKDATYETTFMPIEFFRMHAEHDGFPAEANIDTIVVNSFSEIPSTPEGLRAWQSRLVRFNNVAFQNADGKTVFSTYKSSGVNQPIVDQGGQTLDVRTSGYSSFWNNPLPQGRGDVVGILSYYNSGWQVLLNGLDGCMNFGNPTIAPGLEDNPYTIDQAIALVKADKKASGWVAGYIVGAVAPEVTAVTSNADIEWSADVVMENTLVIGATPDTKDLGNAMIIALPDKSSLRQYGNLADHPENYQKKIEVKGTFGMYMDTYGILDNTGAPSMFKIEGVEIETGVVKDGDGTEEKPYNVAQIIKMNPTSTTEAVATGVWVSGYIVGSMPTGGSSTTLSGTEFSTKDAATTNIVIAPTADCKDYNQCIGIQLPTGDVRNALNLSQNPGLLGAAVQLKGDVMKYCGGPGLKNTSAYKTSGGGNNGGGDQPDEPTPGVGDGDGTQASPYNVGQIIKMNPTSTTEAVATGVWVSGYIVGSMPTGGSSTTLSGTEFSTKDAATTNIVIAPTADCKDYKQCIGIQLPTGDVRNALNLSQNPGLLGAAVQLKGDVMKYCGGPGLKNTSAYKTSGGGNNGGGDQPDEPTPGVGEGDGTQASPYNVARALQIIKDGAYTDAEVYVQGTISEVKEVSTQYGNATYFISDDGTSANQLEVFRGYYLDGNKFSAEDQIKVGDKVVVLGKLVMYGGNTPEITQGNKLVSINSNGSKPDTPDEPDKPDTPVTGNTADFNTFNGGKANTMSYGEYTTASGWKTEWALILAGGTDATNFVSESASFLFPCIDGTTARPGKLTSPTIAGGLKKLTFKYGFPYNETKVGFTVNIIQNGAVAASQTVVANPATKATPFTFEHDFNITGDFVIEIVNDLINNSTKSNGDRVAIWDLTWEN